MTSLTEALTRFDAVAAPGPFAYPRTFHHDGGRHDTHLVFGSLIHGDEVGSLPAVIEVAQALASGALDFGGRLTLFVGNPEAGLAGRRFLDSDLNRVFVDDPPDDHEGRRARELMPILDAADVFLDLHQTILPSDHAFWIAPFQTEGWHWARALGATSMWITRSPGTAFSTGTMCADEYVRQRGRPALTLELGERGWTRSAHDTAAGAMRRAMALADAVARGDTSLAAEASTRPELRFVETVHREPFATRSHALRPGIHNFVAVQTGESLHAPGTPEMIATHEGWLVFPKYPERDAEGRCVGPVPGEIYRIVAPMSGHPVEVYADGIAEVEGPFTGG